MTRFPPPHAFALTLALATFVCAPAARAQDRADIDPARITGNRELPKALYIVPWKKPLPESPDGKPLASVVDEVLAPIDRDVFRRRLRYDAIEQAQASARAPSAAR